ncbi:uncharacterized protein TNCV_611181 [Trichonephila clavipes]|nr:uncharacterized protein TNCV_611181 [Trichonephila clavipes]
MGKAGFSRCKPCVGEPEREIFTCLCDVMICVSRMESMGKQEDMHTFIFSVTFLFILDNSLAWSEGCNPIECFNVLDTLFHSNTEEEPCQKVTKLEKCAIVCLSTSLNSSVMKGIQEVKKNLCEHEQSFKLANKCENKHKYSFFACIYMNLHLEALEKDTNKSLLMCRQASEGQYCDRESLPFCTDRDYHLSGVILESFFKPMYLSNCFFSIGEVFDLKLKPLAYKSDYKDLAVCFDTNSPHISDCVPKKWIATNTLIDAHFTNKLCRADLIICLPSQALVKGGLEDSASH